MTHSEMVAMAAQYLRRELGCKVVLTEPYCPTGERPDAIGWNKQDSFVIECKTSIADVRANLKKPWMLGGQGVGRWRFFLVPDGLIDYRDVWDMIYAKSRQLQGYPDTYMPEDWGLLYAHLARGIEKADSACPRDHYDTLSEIALLSKYGASR